MRLLAGLAAVLCVLATSGCATIVHGTTQEVTIGCDLATAEILVDGKPAKAGKLELDRGNDHEVLIRAEGYETARATIHSSISTGWAFVETALGLSGFIAYGLGEFVTFVPLLVDSLDGAIDSLDVDTIFFRMRKLEEFPPVPTIAVDADELARFCPRCGADFDRGAKFCASCGAPRNSRTPLPKEK
jgi:hypothetical protein